MTNKQKITIYIDESGTLPDPKDKIVVLAAVGFDLEKKLSDLSNKVRKSFPLRKVISYRKLNFIKLVKEQRKYFSKNWLTLKLIFSLSL